MILRAFTDTGIEEFSNFLVKCREDRATPPPRDLLSDDAHTIALDESIEISEQSFTTRGDAAHYLRRVLQPLSDPATGNDAGLWTWLTLFYFDQVCPSSNGAREVKNDYYYIFEPENARHFYRHLLYVGWRVLYLAGDFKRLYMNTPLSSLDGVTTEVMKRLYLTRIPCMFEVLDRLYWDDKRGGARPGVIGTGTVNPGDLTHRLPMRIRQLEKTYDLYSLNADQLLDLLGEEFKR